MLSAQKDYSKITINPTFNLTVNNESLGNGAMVNNKNDELFFSFSTLNNKDKRYRNLSQDYKDNQKINRNKIKQNLEMGQIREYLDKMKVKYGDFQEDSVIQGSEIQKNIAIQNSGAEI